MIKSLLVHIPIRHYPVEAGQQRCATERLDVGISEQRGHILCPIMGEARPVAACPHNTDSKSRVIPVLLNSLPDHNLAGRIPKFDKIPITPVSSIPPRVVVITARAIIDGVVKALKVLDAKQAALEAKGGN